MLLPCIHYQVSGALFGLCEQWLRLDNRPQLALPGTCRDLQEGHALAELVQTIFGAKGSVETPLVSSMPTALHAAEKQTIPDLSRTWQPFDQSALMWRRQCKLFRS